MPIKKRTTLRVRNVFRRLASLINQQAKQFSTFCNNDQTEPLSKSKRNAASRPTVIDKDQPIKSLGSIRRDEIFAAFDMYIKCRKSPIFGEKSCDMSALVFILPAEQNSTDAIGRHGG